MLIKETDMPSTRSYTTAYVTEARAQIDLQLSTYHDFRIAAEMGEDKAALGAAIDAFEPPFFRNLILAMDRYFADRDPALEGDAMTEVRTLVSSILHTHHKVSEEGGIPILSLKAGDDIRLKAQQFARLSEAFFSELELNYVKV
jgi:hypothetical protein